MGTGEHRPGRAGLVALVGEGTAFLAPVTPGFPFTDRAGREWRVYDFRMVDRKKKRVTLSSHEAEARAFVAGKDVMVFRFGLVAYRDVTEHTLVQQLAFAKPWAAYRGTSLNEKPA